MNKPKSKGRLARRRNYWLMGSALVVVAAGLLYLIWANARRSPPTGRDGAETFEVAAHAGEPAPAFSAIGADGQPYAITPGDGRPKAIIFYMGFG